LGSAIYGLAGFSGIAALTLLIPLAAAAIVIGRKGPAPLPQTAAKGPSVLASVMRPGIAAGLAGFSYSALAFFSVLLFLDRDWAPTWAPFTAFAVALILMRVAFPRLPDQLGARKTALIFLGVQIVGLAAMMQGAALALALAGSFVAGIGYAFIYPALGREAVQSVPPERVGLALGYYSAFFDLSMGVSGLVLGQVADQVGLWAVFLVAILTSLFAATLVRAFPKQPIT
jgi:MFS family permease